MTLRYRFGAASLSPSVSGDTATTQATSPLPRRPAETKTVDRNVGFAAPAGEEDDDDGDEVEAPPPSEADSATAEIKTSPPTRA